MSGAKMVILIVCIGAASGIYLAMRPAVTPPPTMENPSNDDGGFEIVKGETGGRILIEAEDCISLETPFSQKSEANIVTEKASKKKCLYLGPEKVNGTSKIRKLTVRYQNRGAKHPGFARYEFAVPDSGKYTLWLRTNWVDDCGDSLLVSIRDTALVEAKAMRFQTIGGTTYKRWTWNQLKKGGGEPFLIPLTAGKTYELILGNREDDLYIDQILLRDSRRAWADPVGIESASVPVK